MTHGGDPSDPRYFATPESFRNWLERHHEREPLLWVGFRKRGSGLASMSWPESVDEALCFGWIDGVRKRLDDETYVIRFTPRKASSTWSAVNTRRMAELSAAGRVAPAGLAAFERRSEAKTAIYSYEQRAGAELGAELEARFRARNRAWDYFQAQAPWYRRTATYWVVSAKKEETRLRRFEILVDSSESGKPIPNLDRTPVKGR